MNLMNFNISPRTSLHVDYFYGLASRYCLLGRQAQESPWLLLTNLLTACLHSTCPSSLSSQPRLRPIRRKISLMVNWTRDVKVSGLNEGHWCAIQAAKAFSYD